MSGYHLGLESKNWVGGGTVAFPLEGIPAQNRIRNVVVTCELAYTKSAADAITGDQFPKLITNLMIGNFISIGGVELAKLNWMVDGHVAEDPSVLYSVPGSGTSGTLYMQLVVPFRDLRQPSSDDGSLPVELTQGRNLLVTFAPGTVFGVGTFVINSGVVRTSVEYIHETNVPQVNKIGFADASSQSIRLEPGIYKDLMLCKQDGSNITSTDVSLVEVKADGRSVVSNMQFQQLIGAWNRTGQRNSSSTNRGELGRTSSPFLPIAWQDNSGKSNLTKQILVEKELFIQITGSLQNPRLVYWRAVAKNTDSIAQIAKAVGAPPTATVYEPATTSKTPSHAPKAGESVPKKTTAMYQHLAGKFREEPTPGNKMAGG